MKQSLRCQLCIFRLAYTQALRYLRGASTRTSTRMAPCPPSSTPNSFEHTLAKQTKNTRRHFSYESPRSFRGREENKQFLQTFANSPNPFSNTLPQAKFQLPRLMYTDKSELLGSHGRLYENRNRHLVAGKKEKHSVVLSSPSLLSLGLHRPSQLTYTYTAIPFSPCRHPEAPRVRKKTRGGRREAASILFVFKLTSETYGLTPVEESLGASNCLIPSPLLWPPSPPFYPQAYT
ncbi:hypothetical protein F4820DRAFT_71520 [Hypoxylon rubiginosum]|uniref:Uncharacterized protein n=1 Tax=Hypoxylon rubiginosum TaxID=110542 RepID=A0ACB9YQ71_9PEZI|nr:hypothetical protein F4820DRAFT_71520 [Hypoxylon rubiginosum]